MNFSLESLLVFSNIFSDKNLLKDIAKMASKKLDALSVEVFSSGRYTHDQTGWIEISRDADRSLKRILTEELEIESMKIASSLGYKISNTKIYDGRQALILNKGNREYVLRISTHQNSHVLSLDKSYKASIPALS